MIDAILFFCILRQRFFFRSFRRLSGSVLLMYQGDIGYLQCRYNILYFLPFIRRGAAVKRKVHSLSGRMRGKEP